MSVLGWSLWAETHREAEKDIMFLNLLCHQLDTRVGMLGLDGATFSIYFTIIGCLLMLLTA